MKFVILPLCSVLAFFPVVSYAQEASPAKPDAPAKEAAAAKPETLIQELYKTEENVFFPEENKKLSTKFLAASLLKLIVKSTKAAGEEAGGLDFDVLTYAQDERKITKFATQSEVKGDTAVVKTSFENHGERMVIKYQCVKEAGQWRISDVTYEDGNSLVKLLTAEE
jgi:hypothetical protein